MATTGKQGAGPHCSSSSSSSISWDVFLSFYGKDTRGKFTAHLYSALVREGISTFLDDPELKKGEEISSELLHAIRGSKIFVIVLSENYAYSRWCLDELAEILTCQRTNGRLVIPVFYYADPSDVRHVKGSFGDALDVHRNRYSVDVIEKWKYALAEIGKISGYHLKTDANENEADTIQKIVEQVIHLTSTKDLHLEEYLVGINSSVEEIYQKLSPESNDVRVLGVCGMGGIGKTTAVKAFYNKYSNKFDISCFVNDVKQHSQGGSNTLPFLHHLSVKLFGRMDYKVTNDDSVKRKLKQFLCTKKALIVVDDLVQSSYIEELLVEICDWVFDGSRIIFTARDAFLVNQLKKDISVVDIYKMRKLEKVDSLELFSYHAFRKTTPPESFKELSKKFVHYCEGLPLALKVLGSSLFDRTDVSFWKDKLAKVRESGENVIKEILQMSYDELGDEKYQAIFLDIVFFFIGRDKDEAVQIFQSCGFFPNIGIPILEERCLLTVDENNKFRTHNVIQHMGKEVIHEESRQGNCRRLDLRQENPWVALQNMEGIQKIEGLVIDLNMSKERQVDAKILERMPKLRLLEIIGANDIEGNFRYSFHELRCIRWHHCPWTHLPSSFCPQKLVSLHMPYSELKTLWKGITPSVELKTINLSYSRNLKIMPDLSKCTLVDKLLLHGCKSLLKVHQSVGKLTNLSHLDLGGCSHLKELIEPIGQLTKLGHLDLDGCVKLKRLPEAIIQLTSMGSLKLAYCSNLTRLPEQLGDMKCLKMLDASYTSIEQLPGSIGQLKKLVKLKLYSCKKLRKLPEQIGKMESLELFDASYTSVEQLPESIAQLKKLVKLKLSSCKKLRKLPEQIGKMESLESFDASWTAIEHLPDTFVGLVNLEELNLKSCGELKQLPEQLGKMQCLRKLRVSGAPIEELPDSIGQLNRLQLLDMQSCRELRNITPLAKLCHHQEDDDMVNDTELLKVLPSLETLNLHYGKQSLSTNEQFSLCKLSNLQHLTLHEMTSSECSFPELPLNLKTLGIFGYASLEMLPDLSSLKQLKKLQIRGVISLQSLPQLPLHLNYLYVEECTSLQDLPDVSIYKELSRLGVRKCSNLNPISLKRSFLKVVQHKLHSFEADTADREVGEWFSYKSRGNKISFTIPPNMGDHFFGLGLWVVYKCKYADYWHGLYLRADIINETREIKDNQFFDLPYETAVGEVQSRIQCMSFKRMKSGDRIKVSFQSFPYYPLSDRGELEGGRGQVKVQMCGAHLIPKTPSFIY